MLSSAKEPWSSTPSSQPHSSTASVIKRTHNTHPPHAPTNVTEHLEKGFSVSIVRVNTYPTMTILDALKLSYGLIAFRKAASYLRPEKAYSLPISSMSMAMRGDMRHGARKLQLQWSSYGAKDTAGM
jgi:hypothetical protein